MKRKITAILLRMLLLGMGLGFGGSLWAAPRIIHRSISNGVIGLEKKIEASLSEPEKFMWAKLYIKKANEALFFPIPMHGSGRYFDGTIPDHYMVQEGVRYYLEVTLQDNSKLVYPSDAPNDSFQIKNQSINEKINISILVPKENEKVTEKIPKMTASIRGLDFISSKEKIKVTLNGQNVSAEVKFGFVNYEGNSSLPPGRHVFEVAIFDEKNTKVASSTREFNVVGSLSPAEEISLLEEEKNLGKNVKQAPKWKTSGNLGVTYQYAKTEKSSPGEGETTVPYPDGYYNVTGQFKASNDDTNFFLGPFSISSQTAEGGNRVNQLSFGFEKGKFSTKLGQISSSLNPLTAAGVSIMGGEVFWQDSKDKDKPGYNAKFFAGQTKIPVEGGGEESLAVFAQRAYGAHVDIIPVPGLGMFSISYANIADDKNSIANRGYTPVIQNQATSLLAKLNMPAFTTMKTLEIEFGFNRNQTETLVSDQIGDIPVNKISHGWGITATANGELKNLATIYSAKTQLMNPDFLTAAGSSQADILGFGFTLSHNLFNSKLSLSEKADFSQDNLNGQKESTSTTLSGGVNATINLAPLPAITLSDNIQRQANVKQESLNNSASASTSYSFKLWSVSVSTGFSFSQNNTWNTDFSQSEIQVDKVRVRTYAPSLSFAPFSFIDFSGSYNYSENLNEKAANPQPDYGYTKSYSLTTNLKLFGGFLTIPFSYSRANNYDDKTPRQTDTQTDNYTSGLNFNLHQNHKLTMNGSYAKTSDLLNSANNYNNLSVTVNYNATL